MNARLTCALLTTGALIALAVPTASGAGGYAGPGQGFEGGVTGLPGGPASAVRYSALLGHRQATVVATEVDGGEIRESRSLGGPWTLPAVTIDGESGGLSADGRRLVLTQAPIPGRSLKTEFLVLDTDHFRVSHRITLDGLASFDAISPDGRLVYFVRYEEPANPFDYEVRAYDLERDRLLPGEIVDPEEPDEQMSGEPVARATSPDGRWVYTAYAGGEEAFIHALDTQEATAVCIDLTQFTPDEAYRLELGAAGGTIRVLRRGELEATVDPETFEVTPSPRSPAPANEDGSPWPVVIAVAAVAAGLLGLAALLRRRRADEAGLGEIFAGAEAQEAPEPEREPEPVP
jgi:MYXO-CTERM domain-containing protein